MSYYVTITFDLIDAANSKYGGNVYKKITNELSKVDYSKVHIVRKTSKALVLPSNTYVAQFEDDSVDKTSDIKRLVKKELKEIFKLLGVSGKYFIAVGKSWSVSCGTF